MRRVLERGLHIHSLTVGCLEAPLHTVTVRDDVEAPLREVPDLVLGFADDDLDDCLVQPVRLGRQPLRLLAKRVTAGLVTRRPRLRVFRVGR